MSVLLAQDVESFSSSSVMMPSRSSSSITRGRPDPDDRTLYICLFFGNRGTSATRILSTVSDEEAGILLADFYDEVDLEEEEGDGGEGGGGGRRADINDSGNSNRSNSSRCVDSSVPRRCP